MNKLAERLKALLFLTFLGVTLSACTAPVANLGTLGKMQKWQVVACLDGERPGRG